MNLLRKLIIFSVVALITGLLAFREQPSGVYAKISPGPPLGMTGAPGEGTCVGCHYTYGGSNGRSNLGPGNVQITGLPDSYVAGQSYTVTVTITANAATVRRWGFELTAVDGNGSTTNAGTLTVTDAGRTLLRSSTATGQSRDYLSHNDSAGTWLGQTGSASWSFNWMAPAMATGDVTFYAAGNAADGQVTPEGDYIYTSAKTVRAPATNRAPVIAAVPDRTLGAGDQIRFRVMASDPDNQAVTLSASALANAIFDAASGRFVFAPAAGQTGMQQVTFTASDGQAQSQQTVRLQVLAESATALTGLSQATGPSSYLASSGAGQVEITAFGNFGAGAVIVFNGLPLTTQATANGLSATIPASELTGLCAGCATRVRLSNNTLTTARIFVVASAINQQKIAAVEAAAYTSVIAPGQIAALFGQGLTADGASAATALPLPRSLRNATLYINGISAPLFFASVSQINFQTPYYTATGAASLVVLRDDGVASYGTVNVAAAAPALFTADTSGQGQAVALHADFTRNGDPALIPAARRVRRGEVIILYGSGLGADLSYGAITLPVVLRDGEAAPANPLLTSLTMPVVTIGGKAASVTFSGLAPGFVGLWQLNVMTPVDAPVGAAVELNITMGARVANRVTIAVE